MQQVNYFCKLETFLLLSPQATGIAICLEKIPLHLVRYHSHLYIFLRFSFFLEISRLLEGWIAGGIMQRYGPFSPNTQCHLYTRN